VRVLLRYDLQPLENKGIKLDPEESWPKSLPFRPVIGDIIRSGKTWPQGVLELKVRKVVVDDPYMVLELDITGDIFWLDGGKRLTWTEWYARLRTVPAPPRPKTPPGPSDCPFCNGQREWGPEVPNVHPLEGCKVVTAECHFCGKATTENVAFTNAEAMRE
jgi:hypothetical protein